MKPQILKQQYKNLLSEIASINIAHDRHNIVNQLLPKLSGYLVMIDLLENKDIANYDPIVEKDNGIILESVGLLLLSNTIEQKDTAVSNLIDNIKHNFMDHYRSQVEFDLQEAIDSLNESANDIEYDPSHDHVTIQWGNFDVT